jgi:type II secretion system protein C
MTFNIPERYLLAINILLGALLIPYIAARTVSEIIKFHYAADVISASNANGGAAAAGDMTATQARAAYNIIAQRDIFNLEAATAAPAPVVKEDLNITLLGTSHLTGGGPAFVVVEDQSGVQQLYRLGDTIPDVGRVVRIEVNRAILVHDGHRVAIEIPSNRLGQSGSEGATGGRPGIWRRGRRPPFIRRPPVRPAPPPAKANGVSKLAPNKYAIQRSTIQHNMKNMSQLFTEVRALPVLKNGQSNGFRLSEIEPGSIFEDIGLQNGDVLTEVSGQKIGNPAHAMQMLSTLPSRSAVTLNVLRDGAPIQLTYTIR